MVLESTISEIGKTLTNPYTYFLLVILLSFLLFLLLKSFGTPKLYAGISALLVTSLLLEFILEKLFQILGTPISFGTYDVHLPVMGTQSIGVGVMFMRLLDFVLNFGLFRGVGIPYIDAFNQTIPAGQITHFPANISTWALISSIFSSWFNLGVFLYNTLDDILGYIFFFYLFYALLVILADIVNASTSKLKLYALILGAIPVLAYNYFVSSSISSYKTSISDLQTVAYFVSHGDTTSLAIFWGTLAISFLIVMEIVAVVLSLFSSPESTGAKAFKPSWESNMWDFNTQGTSFTYTLAFAIVYAMNQYPWFVFFPAVVLFTFFKKFSSGAEDIVKDHETKQEMRDYTETVQGKKQSTGASGGMSGTIMVILIIATAVMGYMFFRSLGWV